MDLCIGDYHQQKDALMDTERVVELFCAGNEECGDYEADEDQAIVGKEENVATAPLTDESITEHHDALRSSTSVTIQPVAQPISPTEKATQDLRAYILSNLTQKVDELHTHFATKIQAQDEAVSATLKRLEERIVSAGDKGKNGADDAKGGKKPKGLKK